MKNENNYQEYLNEQMRDPEFAALYALARKKIQLEVYLEKLRENIEKDVDKKILIKELNKITNYVRQISLT
jgi:hypothetical protein